MASEPGAEQDSHVGLKWLKRVRARHRLNRFSPPFAACRCGGWQLSAPADHGVIQQRDYLLDGFLGHKRFMRAEKKRLKANGVQP